MSLIFPNYMYLVLINTNLPLKVKISYIISQDNKSFQNVRSIYKCTVKPLFRGPFDQETPLFRGHYLVAYFAI